MKLLNVDTLQQAQEKLLQACESIELKTESLPLPEAAGKILAEDIQASYSVPDFRKSTVDGYAIRAADTQGAGDSIPCFLRIIGDVSIGTCAEGIVEPGQCMYVPTGGMLPEGADAMVMVEHTELFSETQVAVYDAVSSGRNVIQIGEDTKEGTVVLRRGQQLTPSRIGVLASLGYNTAPVFVQPTITILSTGNELVKPGQKRHPGQICDINTYGIQAQCIREGLQVIRTDVLPDEEDVLRGAILQAAQNSDIVAVSGGSSQGKQDYTEKIFNECSDGGVFTHGLSLKPGKPTILGLDQSRKSLLIGLPGHPMAAMVVFDLLVLGTLRRRMGVPEKRKLPARMEVNVAGGNGRTVCQMVRLQRQEDGIYLAQPLLGKSGLISVLAKADGYVMIEADKEGLKKGEAVEVTPL